MADRQFPDFLALREPELLFDPIDSKQRHIHPLEGLLAYGPYSQAIVEAVPKLIRIATILPRGEGERIANLLSQLRKPMSPEIRGQYLPRFPGFEPLLRTTMALADPSARIELDPSVESEITGSSRPHEVLARALTDAIRRLAAQRGVFDIVMIYLPDRWSVGFEGPGDFDLHDFLKGVMAGQGIPSQVINEPTTGHKPDQCGVLWSLSIAIYAKAGGVPWKLKAFNPEAMYLGLSYSLGLTPAGVPRFVTCCSQAFDAEGTGFEFIAYETDVSRVRVVGRNPYLDREQMRAVMSRSLAMYLARRAGKLPKRIVVHKTTRFTKEEAEGAMDALNKVREVELLQVQDDTRWRAVKTDNMNGKIAPTPFPVERGSLQHLGPYELLLWTQGNTQLVGGRNFFKEGTAIPRPILLRRWAGSSPAETLAEEVLGLTKMNWNNDALYDFLPTTVRYSQELAQIVGAIPKLDARPYSVRFFM
ncbi:MAG TPA: hypothetical protein VHK65_06310 [Candidatus Dormibacteraeota bacterium]|nr:hypothetical protein [Candidatus Dormibacteraeota bacterium]